MRHTVFEGPQFRVSTTELGFALEQNIRDLKRKVFSVINNVIIVCIPL